MAATSSIQTTPSPRLSVETNTYGTVTFEHVKHLTRFANDTSVRLAALLHVLMQTNQQIDDGFMTDVLELANDMAFQLQGATEILTNNGGAEK